MHWQTPQLAQNPSSVEFSLNTGRRRETEIAARDDRLAPAVSLQLLGLTFLGAGIDILRRKHRAQPAFALRNNLGELRLRGKVHFLSRLGNHTETHLKGSCIMTLI